MTKFCAISDLHGNLPTIPECDALLIAGDICPSNRANSTKQANDQIDWLNSTFRRWLAEVSVPVFAIAGNHDWCFQLKPHEIPELPWTYLQDSGTEFEGFKIYGTPWTNLYYDWAFMREEKDLKKYWRGIPNDTDILITHGPPKYFGDLVDRGELVGSMSLLERVIEVNPKLVVFGHIHEGRGSWDHFGIKIANVTHVNKSMNPVYEPWLVELNHDGSSV